MSARRRIVVAILEDLMRRIESADDAADDEIIWDTIEVLGHVPGILNCEHQAGFDLTH